MSPVVGTAWLGRLFTPWAWSGSISAARRLTRLRCRWPRSTGSFTRFADHLPSLRTSGTPRFSPALRLPATAPAGVSHRPGRIHRRCPRLRLQRPRCHHRTNPVFLAAMVLLTGLPAVVLTTASGRWTLRRGILLLCASAPLLGYVSLNPPLLVMIGGLVALMPLLVAWLDGRAAARRALRTLALGLPLLGLASSYWLVPTLLQLKIEATATLASPSSWIWTEGRATLANGFWLNNSWGWNYSQYFPFAGSYDKFPLLILKFLLPVTAFGFLALARFPRATGRRPPGAPWHRCLGHGTFPGLAQHRNPPSRRPHLRPALRTAPRLAAQGARPVPDARRARLLCPLRADHGGGLGEAELVRAGRRMARALSLASSGVRLAAVSATVSAAGSRPGSRS